MRKIQTHRVHLLSLFSVFNDVVQIVFWKGHEGNSYSKSLFAEFILCLNFSDVCESLSRLGGPWGSTIGLFYQVDAGYFSQFEFV